MALARAHSLLIYGTLEILMSLGVAEAGRCGLAERCIIRNDKYSTSQADAMNTRSIRRPSRVTKIQRAADLCSLTRPS
jgi:hypothetical protein